MQQPCRGSQGVREGCGDIDLLDVVPVLDREVVHAVDDAAVVLVAGDRAVLEGFDLGEELLVLDLERERVLLVRLHGPCETSPGGEQDEPGVIHEGLFDHAASGVAVFLLVADDGAQMQGGGPMPRPSRSGRRPVLLPVPHTPRGRRVSYAPPLAEALVLYQGRRIFWRPYTTLFRSLWARIP